MEFSIDRDLPVPLRTQLQGLIEYGIACGELVPGELLPSVRELAERIGVAPMTVSQVYGDLKAAGLIETRPGSGSFVTSSGHARLAARPEATQLHRRIDALIDAGHRRGHPPGRAGLAGQRARLLSRQHRRPHADRHDRAVHRRHRQLFALHRGPPRHRRHRRAADDFGDRARPRRAGACQFGRPRGHLRQPPARGDGAGSQHQGGVDQLHPIGRNAKGAGRAGFAGARRRHFPASGFPADHEGRRPALRAACRASDRSDAGNARSRRHCSRVSDVVVFASGAEDVSGAGCGRALPRSNTGTLPTRPRSSGCWCR